MCKEGNKMTIITNPCHDEESRLYDSEQNSDITFVAGYGDDTWRFPGHRAVLAAANPVFRAMLCGPMAPPLTQSLIDVKDVDKRAFEQLMRYLYGQPVSLSSVGTARATLEVAHRYLCPGLLKVCVNYLDQNLTPRSVLEVFQNLRYFCSGIPSPNLDPSAPSIKTVQQHQDETNKVGVAMIEMCDSLLLNCLLFIDENADEVLEQEIIEELSFEDIAIVAPRDTLRVTCETKLFNALSRWCVSECKRCKKELTSANRRQVLGQLSYSVRYLLMTEKEFIEGPRASELLDLTECDLILRKMRGEKNLRFTEDQSILLYKFATPRLTTNNIQPIILSERSLPRNPARVDREVDKIDPKKLKKQRKKAEKEMKKKLKESEKMFEESNGCSCTCFGDSLLRAFVCIFD